VNLHDLLAIAILLGQLTSWLSLRERLARLEGGLVEFKGAIKRELGLLWNRVRASSSLERLPRMPQDRVAWGGGLCVDPRSTSRNSARRGLR